MTLPTVAPDRSAGVSRPGPPASAGTPGRGYKWELLVLFWFANFLNQGDRQIFNAILPAIRDGLGASDVQMGLVSAVFTLVYGLLVPVAGLLGDRLSRKWLVCLSLLVFSGGTLLTGLAGGLVSLIVFRCIATGAGESFYTPPALSLLSQHHVRTRALALAVIQTSLYIGIIASSVIAAAIAERWGWRAAFATFGWAGILLAIMLVWRLRNDAPPADDRPPAEPPAIAATLGRLAGNRTALYLSAAFACHVFVNIGFLTWMPTLLMEQHALTLTNAAFQAVFLHHVCAMAGVIIGGWWSDRRALRDPAGRLPVAALGLLLSAPCVLLLGWGGPLIVVQIALGAYGFVRGLYDANIYATLYEVVPVRLRATATGLMIACAFATGALSPFLLGLMKAHLDWYAGFALLTLVYLVGAACILVGARRTFARDRSLA
jgi:MFS family permease